MSVHALLYALEEFPGCIKWSEQLPTKLIFCKSKKSVLPVRGVVMVSLTHCLSSQITDCIASKILNLIPSLKLALHFFRYNNKYKSTTNNINNNMPIPGSREAAFLHSTTPSHNGGNPASLHSPVEAPSPVVTGSTSVPEAAQPLLHPFQEFSEDPQVLEMKAFCNNCMENVSGRKALGHMFFGNLKCSKCPYIINRCSDFQNSYPPKGICKLHAQYHIMTNWAQPVWSYLSYCARRNFHISQFCQKSDPLVSQDEVTLNILSYIKPLKPLMNIEPWKNAFKDAKLNMNIDVVNMVLQPQQNIPNENKCQSRLSPTSTNVNNQNIHSGDKGIDKGCTASISAPQTAPEALKLTQIKFHKQESKDNSAESSETEDTKEQSTQFAIPVAQTTQKLKSQETTQMQHNKAKRARQQNMDNMQSTVQTTQKPELTKESSNNMSAAQREHSKRKQSHDWYSDFIRRKVSESENFLVIQYPEQDCPEACPNCYSAFDPEMCVVNLSTFITDLICPECHLSVYIVLKRLHNESVEHMAASGGGSEVSVKNEGEVFVKNEVSDVVN